MLLWIARILLYIPLSILHPTFIKGRKNMPKGKAILSCNHRSNWDIALYMLHTSRRPKIMAKKELFKNKFMGGIVKSMGGFPIDREGNDMQAIKLCFKTLKDGKQLFVFPEGTRLKDQTKEIGELKSGMAMIAIKTKTPIVPIWIEQKPRLFRKSVYHIGKPFELDEFYGKKLDEQTLNQANDIVKEKMLEIKRELDAKKLAKKSKKSAKQSKTN